MSKKKVVIVGGGTAGLLIAKNLNDSFDVVVFEKSTIKKTPLLNRIPLLIGPLYRKNVLKYIRKMDIAAHKGRVFLFLSLAFSVGHQLSMDVFMLSVQELNGVLS